MTNTVTLTLRACAPWWANAYLNLLTFIVWCGFTVDVEKAAERIAKATRFEVVQ